ncbi:hypothetical protein I4U23_008950 [Adineta vaga]|nr:hypothetical protein I4U23_008950 [Adineta vaga]
MNCIWFEDEPASSTLHQSDDVKLSSQNNQISDTSKDHVGCSSYIHFSHASYTLGFGQLFSGSFESFQSSTPIRQCYSNTVNNTSKVNTKSVQQDHIIRNKIDRAMETIRNTVYNAEKQCNFLSTNPYRNNMNEAATRLKCAANTISMDANRRHYFRS